MRVNLSRLVRADGYRVSRMAETAKFRPDWAIPQAMRLAATSRPPPLNRTQVPED